MLTRNKELAFVAACAAAFMAFACFFLIASRYYLQSRGFVLRDFKPQLLFPPTLLITGVLIAIWCYLLLRSQSWKERLFFCLVIADDITTQLVPHETLMTNAVLVSRLALWLGATLLMIYTMRHASKLAIQEPTH